MKNDVGRYFYVASSRERENDLVFHNHELTEKIWLWLVLLEKVQLESTIIIRVLNALLQDTIMNIRDLYSHYLFTKVEEPTLKDRIN